MWLEWFACWYGCWLCRFIMIWFWLKVTTNYVCDVCEWIYEVKHLDPNEFAKSGCMLALIPRILMALGERPSMVPSTGWDEGGWFCYDVWLRVVGDLCNVYGSVALSCVLMHLDGQFNITNIGMIPKRIFFIWFEPDLSKLLSQAIADGCQIKGPAVGHL